MEDAERVRAECSATPTDLIAQVTWSLVNDSASSRDIRFTSFDT